MKEFNELTETLDNRCKAIQVFISTLERENDYYIESIVKENNEI